jgi:2-phospho-L-lactate guanylyltransferase
MTNLAVVGPRKRFSVAKDRLRQAGAVDVTALARALALGVVRNSAPRHVIILSESDEVTDFARSNGVEVIESNALGLNDAVQRAYETIGTRFQQLMIVHGDLSYPDGLGAFEPETGVTIVTDHRQLGTNVLVLPTGTRFRFSYGSDSMARHQSEAERLRLEYRIITDSFWAYDVDEPEDVERSQESTKGGPKAPFGA